MFTNKSTNLRIPGPVPLPDNILKIVGSQMINHRGPEYAEMLHSMTKNLKSALFTSNDAYFITTSGTGAMEAAIANTIEKGDKVLSIVIGVFGERFTEIAVSYGANVTKLEFPLGKSADLDKVRSKIRTIKDLSAVIFTHNESSTGVTNNLEKICGIIREESNALILVDAVSSAAGIPIHVDKWDIDVVATASQKSWVSPPGIAMVTVSKRAWDKNRISSNAKYYFDFQQYEDYLQIGQSPFTPCLSAMYALNVSLQNMLDEGMEHVFGRHTEIANYTRNKALNNGLEILPDLDVASDTVTAIKLPKSIDGNALVSTIRERHNIVVGGGQKSLTGKIFRIGHMGFVEKKQIDETFLAVDEVLGTF